MAKQNKPAIRFKGFTDAWEQRKAKELCNIGTGKSNTQDQVEDGIYPFYIRSDIPVKSNKYLYDCEAVITIGDGNIGRVFHYVNGKFDLHQRCYKMTDFQDIWGKYFYYFFSTRFYDRAMKMTAKATVDSVRLEMISEMDIWKPTAIDEQKKIAEFFANLDHLITLHQRKYDKLQVLKKAMLEKMFPKNGSSVPEIRFKGFTDAWEQRKLGELLKTITTGKSVNSDDGAVAVGDIGILKTSCVSYDRFNPYESKPVVKDELQSVKCAVEKDSVIVSRMNTPERVGACGYVSTDFPNLFLPDRLWKLKFQDNVDAYFVYMMLVSSVYKEKITSMASGTSGSMYNIPKETFLNLQLVVPVQTSEQRKIGQVLRQLNDLITLHQRELEKLQNIKKSMLEKMFV